jgi:glutamyl-tRNA synthetase
VVERAGGKPARVFQPIRVAITGTTVSPGIFESLGALGKEASLARVERALARMAPQPAGQASEPGGAA